MYDESWNISLLKSEKNHISIW